MSSDKNKLFWGSIISLIFFGLVTVASLSQADLDRSAPLISNEIERHFIMEFVPKYEIADCVIRFSLTQNEKAPSYVDDLNIAFWRYLGEHEPKIGMMIYQNWIWPDHVIYFADQCDRRNEIFEGMQGSVDRYFGEKLSIERLPIAKPVKAFGRLWLDSPDYNPDYWPIYHRAVRKDGAAFLELLRYELKSDFSRQHLYYSLAYHYLPEGALKTAAQQGKDAAWKQISVERQERQMLVVEDWISKIEKYNND